MKNISLKEAAAFLKGCDGALIYTHASPDGDTVGSAVALALILRQMGKEAKIFSVDGIPEKLSFMPTNGLLTDSEASEGLSRISVDVAGPRMLGSAENTHFDLSIDHHKVNTVECDRLLVMDDKIACGEIIFMLADELNAELNSDIATALYGAICSDSGGFKYDATTSETYRMAAKAIDAGADFVLINRALFESKTPSQVALTKLAYQNLELIGGNKFAIVAIPPDIASKCGAVESDFECINSIPREISGVLASAVIRQKRDGVKVSLRSNADIDVAEISKSHGGGGHYHAAGFTHSGDFDSAVDTVKKIFSELL